MDDFKQNFAMIIPQGVVKNEKPKPIARWRKIVCFLIGHKWGFAGITYTGPSFPRKCCRCKKTKWFKKPTIRMRFEKWLDKTLDKLWTPLCKIGVHRWRSHYGVFQYSFGGDPTPPIKQTVYKCSCCKKTKTVNHN